ncbi:hypothetical protein [Pseudomonas mosselii]|uniref:Uncharacterized protein n=1 Tax=Pseudomonas mosselii TaxID=78327 RepID=A0AA42US40_9PSED|nr:hypothetical protein [Pseudomonas mosselii]MDH1629833.1 hypothetical protein [Pseudomonas mosselii]
MNDLPHPRLARSSTLQCKIARRFSERPELLDAADHILAAQWPHYLPNVTHDPRALYLASRNPRSSNLWVRPLSHVLAERFCMRRTLNLTVGEDTLTTRVDGDPAWQVSMPLHQVELLVNDNAPLLLRVYQQSLANYWSRFDNRGETPWHWYAEDLRKRFLEAIEAHQSAGSLPAFALAAARLVHAHPDSDHRNWQNAAGLSVSQLAVDFSKDGTLDNELASALLIEHSDADPKRKVTLLYTLTGKLLAFPSRQDMLESIGRYWPTRSLATSREVSIGRTAQGDFESMALGVLEQQLRVIDHRATTYRSRLDAINMSLELDRLTSMLDLCSESESSRRNAISALLPDWLRNARSQPLLRYSTLLVDVAQSCQNTNGQFWLDGVDNAEDFANRQLAARFTADYPGAPLDPGQVRVVNYQTIAAPAARPGLTSTGKVNPVTFSLAQLAIANIGLLKPGRVELLSNSADPLPAWLKENYLRTVVSELDIASAYPAMLRSKLLDDISQREQRQRLLIAQLASQLPALAQELYLRGKLPDQDVASHIAQVFSTAEDDDPKRWVIRPLGLLKAPGSTVDHPRNTWLIEPRSPNADSCLLYRPLHEDSLLQFSDRLALFVAISTPGALQDDLLQRLPAEDRRFYAHGGFLEPHLFVPLDDTSAIPFGRPAPVELTIESPSNDLGADLYLACVNESIQTFEAHASTSAQTRWTRWKELGWLLFNTLLPLAGGALGKVAWLAQMEEALAEFVSTDAEHDPTGHELAEVNLLVNIALLLAVHSINRLNEQSGKARTLGAPVMPLVASEPKPVPPSVVQAASLLHLDFSWTRPTQTLTAVQSTALRALRADTDTASLGEPLPRGALRGLYLQGDKLYAQLHGNLYQVMLDMPRNQMRIVGPDQAAGPWLRRDEAGRWQLDLSLTLKGGMPLSAQIRKLQLEKESALRTANELIKADKDVIDARIREQTTLEKLVAAPLDDARLQTCQDKLDTLSEFWATHIEHLKQRNTLQPVKEFKKVHAFALYQDSFCQRLLRKVLHLRYQPDRGQLLKAARLQQAGETLTPADVSIIAARLDRLAPLIERMIDNNRRLLHCQDELNKLASPHQPEIQQWRNLASSMPATQERELILRFLRLEGLLNRMTLVHGLSEEACYWRDRFWGSFELGIAQRARLFKLESADDEITARLLRSIIEHLQSAARQLEIFTELAKGDAAQQTTRQMKEQLDWLLSQNRQELDELPDYPPLSTLGQLRKKVPGLIETTEHGLLLAEPRSDDANTVDIPGPDNRTPARTYHLKHGNWVELKPAQTASRPTQMSLKHLLKESDTLIAQTHDEVSSLQAHPNRYLPVEIEESVLYQRTRLLERVDAIETRLTEDNETDEARGGKDAERVAGSLRRLAQELPETATRLRVSAALTQKPRMGEVMYLVDGGHVQVRAEGARSRLARVKGRPADFLDEYSISHEGKVLWYAHFHYPSMTTAKADFTAGHLKTAEQRHMPGQRYSDGSGRVFDVYRALITSTAAARYFFDL